MCVKSFLAALQDVPLRFSDISDEQDIHVTMEVRATGIKIIGKHVNKQWQLIETSKMIAWMSLENCVCPKDVLDSHVDQVVRDVQEAKDTDNEKNTYQPNDPVGDGSSDVVVPVWERGIGCGCQ